MTTLPDLIAELEAADEGSRELDWRIADTLGEVPAHNVQERGWAYDWYRNREDEWTLWRAKDAEGRFVDRWAPKPVTTSIDAAVALCERLLPGWAWSAGVLLHSLPEALVWPNGDEVHSAQAETVPLAITIAVLKAYEAQP